MNQQEQGRWKNELLNHVLAALAAHEPLRSVLVFKGARILNLRLGEVLRQSLDVDSNLDMAFATTHSRADQQEYLRRETDVALRHFLSRQEPVRYMVETTRIEMKPPDGEHPFGWTGFRIAITVRDNMRAGVRGLPSIEIDVAAPETLGANSKGDLAVGGHLVQAYTLERLAGEKMRAFLSSLPAYIAKTGRRTDSRRVKDLYDLARIQRHYELSDREFWRKAGDEFRLACQSRYIDCAGIPTFAEEIEQTRTLYTNDPTLPKDVTFDEAWQTVQDVVEFFLECGLVPFTYPLPTPPTATGS